MSKIVYDPVSNSFVESEGWRSWSCVIALFQYMLTLIYVIWMGILLAIIAVPLIAAAIVISIGVAAVFGWL